MAPVDVGVAVSVGVERCGCGEVCVWRGVGVTPVDVGVGSKAGCGEVWVWRSVGMERCG